MCGRPMHQHVLQLTLDYIFISRTGYNIPSLTACKMFILINSGDCFLIIYRINWQRTHFKYKQITFHLLSCIEKIYIFKTHNLYNRPVFYKTIRKHCTTISLCTSCFSLKGTVRLTAGLPCDSNDIATHTWMAAGRLCYNLTYRVVKSDACSRTFYRLIWYKLYVRPFLCQWTIMQSQCERWVRYNMCNNHEPETCEVQKQPFDAADMMPRDQQLTPF